MGNPTKKKAKQNNINKQITRPPVCHISTIFTVQTSYSIFQKKTESKKAKRNSSNNQLKKKTARSFKRNRKRKKERKKEREEINNLTDNNWPIIRHQLITAIRTGELTWGESGATTVKTVTKYAWKRQFGLEAPSIWSHHLTEMTERRRSTQI